MILKWLLSLRARLALAVLMRWHVEYESPWLFFLLVDWAGPVIEAERAKWTAAGRAER